jgi:hypothetical protein
MIRRAVYDTARIDPNGMKARLVRARSVGDAMNSTPPVLMATHRTAALAPMASPTKRPKPSRHDQLVTQTEKWVATSFYGELLKQAHNSPFKSSMFSGGRGGEVFGAMQDQQIATQMTRGAGKKLVNAIVHSIEAKHAYGHQTRIPSAPRATALPMDLTHSASTIGRTNVPTVR